MDISKLREITVVGRPSGFAACESLPRLAFLLAGELFAEIDVFQGRVRSIVYARSRREMEAGWPDALQAIRMVACILGVFCFPEAAVAWARDLASLLQCGSRGASRRLDRLIASTSGWWNPERPGPEYWVEPDPPYLPKLFGDDPIREAFSDFSGGCPDVVDEAVRRIRERGIGISGELLKQPSYYQVVRFTVSGGAAFRFWNSASRPSPGDSDEHSYDLCPSYHPAFSGREPEQMLNGSNGCLCWRRPASGLVGVHPPSMALRPRKGTGLMADWGDVAHPFRAESSSIDIDVDAALFRSAKDADELERLLLLALDLVPEAYIVVSGGFCSPLRHPKTVLQERGLTSPYRSGGKPDIRGSENRCVFQHRFLEAEGTLAQSFVPTWFRREGWLDIYRDEKPQS